MSDPRYVNVTTDIEALCISLQHCVARQGESMRLLDVDSDFVSGLHQTLQQVDAVNTSDTFAGALYDLDIMYESADHALFRPRDAYADLWSASTWRLMQDDA